MARAGEAPSLAACVRDAARRLARARGDEDDWLADAEVLARAILGWDAAAWIARQRETPPASFVAPFDAAVARRALGEPVAYITGVREFYGRPFLVTRDVLIPRPETELVVESALAAVAERRTKTAEPRVADIGTGSGCLAITLALECPDARVSATDVSDAALTVAEENAARLGTAGRIDFRHASLTAGASASFDVIVSNPPYVALRDRESLAPDVREYEPATALFAGDDGLDVIRGLVPAAARALRPDGWLIFEIGAGQADAVTAVVTGAGDLALVRIVDDFARIPRVVVARRAGSV